jgi:hypothetical protein
MTMKERKPRKLETSQERAERAERSAGLARTEAAAQEDAIDAMVRQSINLHGA